MLASGNSHSRHNAEPRKRPRQERSRRLVAKVLDEATRLFSELGYHATTTNHIAEAAGVSVGSLYQYFPNKDALLVVLAERHIAEAAPAFRERLRELESEQPPIEQVARSLSGSAASAASIRASGSRSPASRRSRAS